MRLFLNDLLSDAESIPDNRARNRELDRIKDALRPPFDATRPDGLPAWWGDDEEGWDASQFTSA